MERRKFLRTAGIGAAAAASAAGVAAPAIAQSAPELNWRMTSSFPKSLDTLYGGAEYFAKIVAEATDNKFQIRTFAAGEIVPGLQVLDAVQNGTVEMGQTANYYFFGKDPTFALATVVPFMLNTRQMNAWVTQGGGEQMLNDFFKGFNVVGMVAGNTTAQMGGWFRKEIKTLEDLKGLKMRIAGLAGDVGPYDDQKLGFVKVAPYYYYPGWWEGNAALHMMINLDKFNALPKHYQQILRMAAAASNNWISAKYDADNPKALRALIAAGAKLLPFSAPILEASFNAANEVYKDLAAKNANFKKVYDSQIAFRKDEVLWFRVAENTFDNFMARQSAADKL
jgi:TRAP-type mannitol/chloroaromatic compound transport system substrate-binding protein